MTDVLVGSTLPQFTDDRDRFIEGVKRAAASGLDSIWVFDHMWPLTGKKARPVLECWTTLAWIAAATENIKIGTLVTRSSLRHPAILAKMAATVAAIAPGRLIVAVGSGDDMSRDENESFGIPYWEGEERVRQLASTVEVLADFFEWGSVHRSDDFVNVSDLPASPKTDAPTLWVGGRSDDVIDVAARRADGWNGWGGTPDRFAQDVQRVLDLAGDRQVEMSWAGLGMLAETDEQARELLGDRGRAGDSEEWIWGAPEKVAERLNSFVQSGARHVILTFSHAWQEGTFELLGGEVRRLLREY
jgi:alkanesulfonate monooxygenase SsuD/methylene tetrahydromethanopterin reductase-like flavin-dependent oxidoreductase (luciferase family)